MTSFVAASYVRDLDRSRAFYDALGFTEQSSGSNELSAWSSLRHDQHLILLVTVNRRWRWPRCRCISTSSSKTWTRATRSLERAGRTVEHVGYPPHAPGGEARTLDPDGNLVLLGQPVASTTQSPTRDDDPAKRFSLLREAATLAKHHLDGDLTCQVPDMRHEPCSRPAEVKLADAWGDTAWACIEHADEVLINTSNAFIANRDGEGLGAFLAHRRRSRTLS